MIRKIVDINEEKCNGCSLCISACAEGALQLVNGKARLISDSYCDGLGACLPECPADAIKIIEREAPMFDEEAVKKHIEKSEPEALACGCPGNTVRVLEKSGDCACHSGAKTNSQLGQWPCQIKLVPANAPYLENADLLIAADCTAYAYADFHQDLMKNRITLIGCPKLDNADYSEKLTEILRNNPINSVTVARMVVPCCTGLVNNTLEAVTNSGKNIPTEIITIDTSGKIVP